MIICSRAGAANRQFVCFDPSDLGAGADTSAPISLVGGADFLDKYNPARTQGQRLRPSLVAQGNEGCSVRQSSTCYCGACYLHDFGRNVRISAGKQVRPVAHLETQAASIAATSRASSATFAQNSLALSHPDNEQPQMRKISLHSLVSGTDSLQQREQRARVGQLLLGPETTRREECGKKRILLT
jgi:hypothetical protein